LLLFFDKQKLKCIPKLRYNNKKGQLFNHSTVNTGDNKRFSMASTKEKSDKKNKAKSGASFPKETYMYWYETMMLMRKFEEKSGQLYGEQKIKGFCHLYIGQEACAAGAVTALDKDDKYITAYRDHAHPIALGTDPKFIMAELFGKE